MKHPVIFQYFIMNYVVNSYILIKFYLNLHIFLFCLNGCTGRTQIPCLRNATFSRKVKLNLINYAIISNQRTKNKSVLINSS